MILARPTATKVFVDIVDRGSKVSRAGIVLPDDDFTERGIRPRVALVLAVGPDVVDVAVGDHVLIPHGDWTRKFKAPSSDGPIDAWMTEESKIEAIVEGWDPTAGVQITRCQNIGRQR